MSAATRRPSRRLLRGRVGTRMVRVLALLQVALGIGASDESEAREAGRRPDTRRPPEPQDGLNVLPASLDARSVETSAYRQSNAAEQRRLARLLLDGKVSSPEDVEAAKQLMALRLTTRLRALLFAELDARAEGRAPAPVSDEALLEALDEAEQARTFDAWIPSFLWGQLEFSAAPTRKRERERRRELLGRLYRHARVVTALTRSRAEVSQIEFVPWRGKAARPQHYSGRDGLLVRVAVAQEFARSDAGTWSNSVVVELRVAGSEAVTRVRGGVSERFPPGARVRLNRLDLIETPSNADVVVTHAELGPLTLPRDSQLGVWQLPALLPASARQRLGAKIGAALADDEAAALWLERALLLAHKDLREALHSSPQAPGAPRLRMILALFDDALVRARAAEPSLSTVLGRSPARGP